LGISYYRLLSQTAQCIVVQNDWGFMVEKHLGKRFEDFVAALFRAEGFDVDQEPQVHPNTRPDLFIRSKTGLAAVVEIKLYRSTTISTSTLSQAAHSVQIARRAFNANASMLVVGNKVTQLSRQVLQQQFPETIIYDIDSIAFLAIKHPELVGELESILREALPFSEPPDSNPMETNVDADISRRHPVEMPQIEGPTRKGDQLCQRIRSTPSGRTRAKSFEERVMEALRYVFDEDLAAWRAQKSTDTKISVYDLVARVSSDHDFWNAIVTQFRSRYIVFEFKNYSNKIKQGQIYTTEKYLYAAALRSTAIIISRNGADNNALAASRGALRETGKLIVNLNIDDLCKMLRMKDQGDDHNAVLVDKVDEMLMKLER
jgi:hypothetical protein